MQPTNFPDSRANSDRLDLFDATDNFKILIHQQTKAFGIILAILLHSESSIGLESNYILTLLLRHQVEPLRH